MAKRKRHTSTQIISKLEDADRRLTAGQNIAQSRREKLREDRDEIVELLKLARNLGYRKAELKLDEFLEDWATKAEEEYDYNEALNYREEWYVCSSPTTSSLENQNLRKLLPLQRIVNVRSYIDEFTEVISDEENGPSLWVDGEELQAFGFAQEELVKEFRTLRFWANFYKVYHGEQLSDMPLLRWLDYQKSSQNAEDLFDLPIESYSPAVRFTLAYSFRGGCI